MIGKTSYEILRTRFQTSDQFWSFHRLFEQKSFHDTVEDERIYNYERVKILVEKYMFAHQIEEVQTILTIGHLKEDFLSTCKRETGLSERKIENILKMDCKRV